MFVIAKSPTLYLKTAPSLSYQSLKSQGFILEKIENLDRIPLVKLPQSQNNA